jgi:hypothetical protein
LTQALLSPLEAYDLAARQKQELGAAFRAEIVALRRWPRCPPDADQAAWQAFTRMPDDSDETICRAYRDLAMRFGLTAINPASPHFAENLDQFYRNYATNFPIPAEQESREGFEALWRDSPREGGYQEIAYSVVCPLTRRYLMGLNITIQPQSDTVHFIYGFVSAAARGIGGFSAAMIAFMRETGRRGIEAHLAAHPQDRPHWHNPAGPLILFEKNIIGEMSLPEILMDSAGVDVDHPPTAGADLSASAIGQSMRDMVWSRRGGMIVDYIYMQSSLDGVVRVPESMRSPIVDFLRQKPQSNADRAEADLALNDALGDRNAGCTALNLCAFAGQGTASVSAAQIRRHNEIFQGISVVKDPSHLSDDIYFQAQMVDLAARTQDGRVGLRPIAPVGGADFPQAEETTRTILAGLTWDDLQVNDARLYRDWLAEQVRA